MQLIVISNIDCNFGVLLSQKNFLILYIPTFPVINKNFSSFGLIGNYYGNEFTESLFIRSKFSNLLYQK